MYHSNNIPETEEEDELYTAVESLLSKAISGTEAPANTSDRIMLNNSVNQGMNSIENDLKDIDETLYDEDYDDDTMQMGGNLLDGLENLGKTVGKVGEKVGEKTVDIASDATKKIDNVSTDVILNASKIIGTGFLTFDGLLSSAYYPINSSSEQKTIYIKVIVCFVIRMIFEIMLAYLFYNAIIMFIDFKKDGLSRIQKLAIYFVTFILIGYKLIGPLFDKFSGNVVYSCLYIVILFIISLLFLASNSFIRFIGNIFIISILLLFLITFLLPTNILPKCFNFISVLPLYSDFKYYTKDTFSGILAFVGCDKLCLIIQLIISCIIIYVKEDLFIDMHVIGNKAASGLPDSSDQSVDKSDDKSDDQSADKSDDQSADKSDEKPDTNKDKTGGNKKNINKRKSNKKIKKNNKRSKIKLYN